MIRCHVLSAGDTLDRRRLTELFQESLVRLRNVKGPSFGDAILGRSKFNLDSFVEMSTGFESGLSYIVPAYGHLVPSSSDSLRATDGPCEGVLSWSVQAKSHSNVSYYLMVWPVIGDQSVFWLGDQATADMVLRTSGVVTPPANLPPDPTQVEANTTTETGPFATGDKISLGNSGVVSVPSNRGFLGLLAFSIGEFSFQEVQWTFRRRVR